MEHPVQDRICHYFKEKNSSGEQLWVWVQSHAFAFGADGQALQQLLANCVASPANYVGKRVFALEKFTRQSGSKGPWSSIPVVQSAPPGLDGQRGIPDAALISSYSAPISNRARLGNPPNAFAYDQSINSRR